MIAEAARSGTGKLFFDKITALRSQVSSFLDACMASGTLRRDDPDLAADHLGALLEAEILDLRAARREWCGVLLCFRAHSRWCSLRTCAGSRSAPSTRDPFAWLFLAESRWVAVWDRRYRSVEDGGERRSPGQAGTPAPHGLHALGWPARAMGTSVEDGGVADHSCPQGCWRALLALDRRNRLSHLLSPRLHCFGWRDAQLFRKSFPSRQGRTRQPDRTTARNGRLEPGPHAFRRRIFQGHAQRRIGLAQALINDPDLVILDEPTAGLDPIGCREVKDLIPAPPRRGKTVILSSHLLSDVEDVCDRVVIYYGGKIQAMGTLKDLLATPDTICITTPALPR